MRYSALRSISPLRGAIRSCAISVIVARRSSSSCEIS